MYNRCWAIVLCDYTAGDIQNIVRTCEKHGARYIISDIEHHDDGYIEFEHPDNPFKYFTQKCLYWKPLCDDTKYELVNAIRSYGKYITNIQTRPLLIETEKRLGDVFPENKIIILNYNRWTSTHVESIQVNLALLGHNCHHIECCDDYAELHTLYNDVFRTVYAAVDGVNTLFVFDITGLSHGAQTVYMNIMNNIKSGMLVVSEGVITLSHVPHIICFAKRMSRIPENKHIRVIDMNDCDL